MTSVSTHQRNASQFVKAPNNWLKPFASLTGTSKSCAFVRPLTKR